MPVEIMKITTGDSSGENGATFIPSIDSEGNLSWSNDKGLENPTPVNIKGPKGETGSQGLQGLQGEPARRARKASTILLILLLLFMQYGKQMCHRYISKTLPEILMLIILIQ